MNKDFSKDVEMVSEYEFLKDVMDKCRGKYVNKVDLRNLKTTGCCEVNYFCERLLVNVSRTLKHFSFLTVVLLFEALETTQYINLYKDEV